MPVSHGPCSGRAVKASSPMGRQFLSWNIIFSNTEHQHVSQGWRLFENFCSGNMRFSSAPPAVFL